MSQTRWVFREDYTCPSCGQPELRTVGGAEGQGPAQSSCPNPNCGRWTGAHMAEQRGHGGQQPTA